MLKISEAEFDDLQREYGGICLHCGCRQWGGVEPDAREYQCEDCGEAKVYGVSELLLMGEIELTENEGRVIHDSTE